MSTISNINYLKLKAFRYELHKYPELSGNEHQTASRIIEFNKQFPADKVLTNIGGAGVALVYEGEETGPTVLFRAELDALPIQELNDFGHKSKSKGISHKCGHDGHMCILLGLGMYLHQFRPRKGKVILLFQPAEETGAGAKRVVNDPKFKALNVDFAFALHNLPGYPLGEVVYKSGTFNAASRGLIAKFEGWTAHAAEPHKGKSPGNIMADLMRELPEMSSGTFENKDFRLLTLVFAQLGEKNFGISPGKGEIRATLRTYEDEQMEKLVKETLSLIQNRAFSYRLKHQISWEDVFPASKNHGKCVRLLEQIAKQHANSWGELTHPMSWSEDFGHFTQKIPGAMFGLGAGVDHPQLHSEYYDFPDELLEIGGRIFLEFINTYNGISQGN